MAVVGGVEGRSKVKISGRLTGGASYVRRVISGVAVGVLFLGILVGCSGAAPGQGDRLSIATGGTGGVYYVYGGGIADQITQNIDGYEATVEATAGSVDNMLLIQDGSSDLALTLGDTASDAAEGVRGFEEPVPVEALAYLYDNITQVVTLADSDIESLEDMEGQRVSVGAPGSGTEVIAVRLFETVGIDAENDIERAQLSVAESVDALRDGTIDAFFWSGGLPTGAITDLASTDEMRIVPLDDYLGPLQEEYGEVYGETTIPAGTYAGYDEEVATIGVPSFFVASAEMEEDLAFDITQLIFDQKEALVEVHPEAEKLNAEDAQQVAPLELHPGAQRYYDEAG